METPAALDANAGNGAQHGVRPKRKSAIAAAQVSKGNSCYQSAHENLL